MKINIIFFSGTGNTAWVIKQLSNKLIQKKHKIDIISTESYNIYYDKIQNSDILGIAYPTYSSNAPSLIFNVISKLKKVDQKKAFVITTMGYISGDTNWFVTKKLEEKGYNIFLSCDIIMGNNLHLPFLSPLKVTDKITLNKRKNNAINKINTIADKIDNIENYHESISILDHLLGYSQRIAAKPFEKIAFKGFQIDKNICINCGKCIKNCPQNNIKNTDNKIYFDKKCIICMRCYNYCPVKAINSTDKTKNLKKYKRYTGPEGKPYPDINKAPYFI